MNQRFKKITGWTATREHSALANVPSVGTHTCVPLQGWISKIGMLPATIALLALASGCSFTKPAQDTSQSTSASSQTSSNNNSFQETVSKPSVQQLSKSHSIGEVVSIKDKNLNVQFTVNGTREHPGKGVIEPNEGQKWIVVDTTIANKGQKPGTFSVVSFELIDSENNQYEVALLAEALDDVESPTGQLNPGDERRGEVAFEVPESAKGLKLIFKPNLSDCEAPASKAKASETLNCEPVVVKLGR
jgi:hypothetical protein